jgi:hypothetical protein
MAIAKKYALRRGRTPAAAVKAQEKNVVSSRLELMITIVNRSKSDYYIDLIQSMEVNMQLAVPAKGTASKEIMNLLGLADNDKTVIFSVIREDMAKLALETIEEKFRTIRNGKGIAYTVPLSSVIGVSLYGFLSNNPMTVRKEEANNEQ